jgi:NAD(P)H dehydrogenase (quinone)
VKILVLYYSLTGNVYRMAKLVAEGVRQGGTEAVIKTVPELMPEELIRESELMMAARKEQAEVPISTVEELRDYDGIIVGTPTRFGNMAAQMRNFWDQTGALWVQGSLIGKPAGVFCSTATLHGGQETTLISSMMTLFHQGMIMVGVPYSEQALITTNAGGTPYGPSHVSGQPPTNPITDQEAEICRALGKRVAEIAAKLAA